MLAFYGNQNMKFETPFSNLICTNVQENGSFTSR